MTARTILALAGGFGLFASAAHAQTLTAIVSTVPGHPTSAVPGEPGRRFTFLKQPRVSPNGQHWIMRVLADGDADTNDMLMVGSGSTYSIVGREGDAAVFAPDPLETLGLFDDACDINDMGWYVFGNNTKDGTTNSDEYIVRWNGTAFETIAREDDPAPGPGGYTYGCCLRGANIQADGSVGFEAYDLRLGDSTIPDALFLNGDLLARSFFTPVINPFSPFSQEWNGFVIDRLHVSENGQRWIMFGSTTAAVEIAAVDGEAVVQEMADLPGGLLDDPVAAILSVKMTSGGEWFVWGDTTTDQDWVLYNGTLVGASGRETIPGSGEHWQREGITSFRIFDASDSGLWVIGGTTDNPDTTRDSVIVLNGTDVVVREGDPVDLDGNGLTDDDAFLHLFDQNESFFTADGLLVFHATIRSGAGTVRGEAMLSIALGTSSCDADLSGSSDPNDPSYGTPDGSLDASDFFYYLDQFVAGNIAIADLSGSSDPNDPAYGVPDGALDASDFFYYLDIFVAGCP